MALRGTRSSFWASVGVAVTLTVTLISAWAMGALQQAESEAQQRAARKRAAVRRACETLRSRSARRFVVAGSPEFATLPPEIRQESPDRVYVDEDGVTLAWGGAWVSCGVAYLASSSFQQRFVLRMSGRRSSNAEPVGRCKIVEPDVVEFWFE